MRHRVFLSIVLLIVAILAGCAKQGMPSGGPKDTEPPKMKRTTPDNRTLQFSNNQFYIEFDEYVVLKDADNNVLVSPPMKNKPEIKTKGRGVQVKIKDTLAENTTYLFQFKDAIADFNEGNLLPSLEYVFTTGSYIDSMSIKGKVVDALTLEPREEAISVWLMNVADGEEFRATFGDTAAPDPRQAYATRCNKDGSFSFNYIRPGKYHIFAVQDEDKNMKLGKNEAVAFLDSCVAASAMAVVVSDTSQTDSVKTRKDRLLQLRMFTPDVEKQRVTGGDFKSSGKVVVTTLLPMVAPVIDGGGEEVIWRLNEKRDTLTLWSLREKCDSLQLVVSDESGLADTLKLKWRPKKGRGLALSQIQAGSGLEMKLNHKALPYYDTLSLRFNIPLGGESGTRDSLVRVRYMKDSSLTCCAVVVDTSLMKASIVYDFKQGEKYEVEVQKDCFKDIYGRGNDSLRAAVNVTKAEEYGNLSMDILLNGEPMVPTFVIVELLNEKGTVVASRWVLPGVQPAKFEHLTPGKYRVRAIVDNNHNKKWDKGDFATGLQPEKVFYFSKTLDVRANWDFEEKLVIEN